MPIKVVCKCGRAYWAAEDKAGKRLSCKVCGAGITIPTLARAETRSAGTRADSAATPGRATAPDRTSARRPTGTPRRLPDEIRNKAISNGWALASNPCCSKVDFLQYFLCRPLQTIMMLNILLFGIGLSIALHNPIPILPAIAGVVFYAWRKTRLVRRVIITGNVNPGIIVGRRPWRVAIYTDLSTGFQGPRPAVKVMKAPVLNWMTGGPPEIGKRICCPSTYMKGSDPTAWLTFYPFVLETLVRDPTEAKAIMDSVDPNEWAPLESWVRRNPKPQFGLYRLWPGASNALVKDSIKPLLVTITWTIHAGALLLAAIAFDDFRTRTKTDDNPVVFQPVHSHPQPQTAAPIRSVETPVPPSTNPGQAEIELKQKLEQSRQGMMKTMQDAQDAAAKQRQAFERQRQGANGP